MKNLIILAVLASSQAFGMEYAFQFVEQFRTKSCKASREAAQERIKKQFDSGSDVYKGSIKEYHDKKIIRFVYTVQGCNAVWSEAEGMLYDYYLPIQIAGTHP